MVSAPSHGALWWFLVKTPAGSLKSYIQKWFRKIPGALKDQLLAIDGKRLRGANFLNHITDDRLCLAVEKVPDKTVEKSTLPVILEQSSFLIIPSWDY